MTHVVVLADTHIRRGGFRRLPDAACGMDPAALGQEAAIENQLLFNPGSPTERRAQPHHTLGTLDVDAGRVTAAAIHLLG